MSMATSHDVDGTGIAVNSGSSVSIAVGDVQSGSTDYADNIMVYGGTLGHRCGRFRANRGDTIVSFTGASLLVQGEGDYPDSTLPVGRVSLSSVELKPPSIRRSTPRPAPEHL